MIAESAARSAGPVRVMVVDDSAVVRGLIARQFDHDPDVEVVCTASNGEIALRELSKHTVDVVVLDIEMPVMDGLAALPLILAQHPGVKVVMASTLTKRNAEASLKALQLGASDYIPKPEGGLAGAEDFQRELIAKVKALAPRRGAGSPAPGATAQPAPRPAALASSRPTGQLRIRPQVLAIGASTGGPPALIQLFEALRGAVSQPILLTQHMPATFTALLAEQLARAGGRPCREARDGEHLQAGHCYVAPGGWHMTVCRDGPSPLIRLNQDPPENFCRPAVDPMLRSVAECFGRGALAVILTGMGSDGAKGCEAIVEAGGRFIAQDEATSVVWGMPGAAAATGLAESILPIQEVGPWLRRHLETAP
jgi:two-component system chemotaxis response regulator CheB